MRIRMGGYYLHESGNSILRVSMVVTFKSGVQQVSGRFVNRDGVVDNYACKRDDFLETFRALPKKAALEQLTSWGVSEEVLE